MRTSYPFFQARPNLQLIHSSNLITLSLPECPPAAWDIHQPLLFVAFNRDFVVLPVFGDKTHGKYAKGPVTREEINGDHWGLMSHAGELSEILLKWVGGLDL